MPETFSILLLLMNVNFYVIIFGLKKMTIILNRNDFQIILHCGFLSLDTLLESLLKWLIQTSFTQPRVD